jgi:hypothetical protein
MNKSRSVDEETKGDLLKVLLEVYMSDGCVLSFVDVNSGWLNGITGKLMGTGLLISSTLKP